MCDKSSLDVTLNVKQQVGGKAYTSKLPLPSMKTCQSHKGEGDKIC